MNSKQESLEDVFDNSIMPSDKSSVQRYFLSNPELLENLQAYCNKQVIEELERFRSSYTPYCWNRNPVNLPGLANPFRIIDNRIAELKGDLE